MPRLPVLPDYEAATLMDIAIQMRNGRLVGDVCRDLGLTLNELRGQYARMGLPMDTIGIPEGAWRPGPARQRGSDLDNVVSQRDWPCYAAGLNYVRPRSDGIPSGVTLPHSLIEGPLTWPGQHAGLLGAAHDPVLVTQDPNAPGFRMDTYRLPDDADPVRMAQRRRLLDRIGETSSGGSSSRRLRLPWKCWPSRTRIWP